MNWTALFLFAISFIGMVFLIANMREGKSGTKDILSENPDDNEQAKND